jgi:hypothetical protein
LELLATVDWLHRRDGVELATEPMIAAIRTWPGPDGAAERKARVFDARDVGIAVEQLQGKVG